MLSSITEGSHTYRATAVDEVGNVSVESAARTVMVDATKPTVESTRPLSGAKDVGRGGNLKAIFSEQMKTSTIDATTFQLFKVNSNGTTTRVTNAPVELSPDGFTATLDPFGASSTTRLAPDTKYKAVLTTGAKDLAGNALDQNTTKEGNQPMRWTFTTRS